MISLISVIFVCLTEAVKADNPSDELFAIESALHDLRACSQSFSNGQIPDFCYNRQSSRSNELARKSRSFWELKGQDDTCLQTPCARKSHKITTKVNHGKNRFSQNLKKNTEIF